MNRLPGVMLALSLVPAAADADVAAPAPVAACMLKVINALPGEGGIDPAISALRHRLEQPPFNTWKTFKLLSAREESIQEGGSAKYPAPVGGVTVSYTGHRVGAGGKHAVKGTVQVEGPRSQVKIGFTLAEGGYFLQAGEAYNGGILIYSLSCKTAD